MIAAALSAGLVLSYSPSAMLRPPVCATAATSRLAAAVPVMQFDFSKIGGSVMEKMGMKPADTGMSEEETQSMEQRLRSGEMTFDDFLKQVDIMQKGASVQAMLGKLGGGGQEQQQLEEGRKKLISYGEYVKFMEEDERADPQLLITEAQAARVRGTSAPRLERLAEATGKTVEDVGRFILEFNMMRGAAVKFANGESPESIRASMMEEQQASGAAPPMNRQQRRMAAKKGKKKAKSGAGGFGR